MRTSGIWQVITSFALSRLIVHCFSDSLSGPPALPLSHPHAGNRRTSMLMLTVSAAEFRGPGSHHNFDDSDEYDVDMDQRTRFIGGRANRIILLGDGTEMRIGGTEDDDDIDMEDRGEAEEEEEKDLEEQVRRGQQEANGASGRSSEQDRSSREETPGPASQGKDLESLDKSVTPSDQAPATDEISPKSNAEHVETK